MIPILIAGGTGLIGQRLTQYLSKNEYSFHILTRNLRPASGNIRYYKWDPANNEIDSACFEGISIIINLAGAGVADKRWTTARKKEILDSRIDSISTLENGIINAGVSPELYIGASAIGYYGDNAEIKLTENSPSGTDFLAEVTSEWETKHREIFSNFNRQVLLRIGIVLSENGGALKEMLKPARFGQYGYFGNGKAYYSWIHIDDICQLISEVIQNENYTGIYNATASEPVTILELVKAMKSAKKGLGLTLPIPEVALKLMLGEMSTMLTNSVRAVPKRLKDEGHQFLFNDAEEAIADILDRNV